MHDLWTNLVLENKIRLFSTGLHASITGTIVTREWRRGIWTCPFSKSESLTSRKNSTWALAFSQNGPLPVFIKIYTGLAYGLVLRPLSRMDETHEWNFRRSPRRIFYMHVFSRPLIPLGRPASLFYRINGERVIRRLQWWMERH
jgi:hypothetical protein